MAEESKEVVMDWDDVEEIVEDDEISEEDQAGSDDISLKNFVGQARCLISAINGIEKRNKERDYTFIAMRPEFTILEIITCDMPLMNDSKPVIRNGDIVTKVRPLSEKELRLKTKEFVGKYGGKDEIAMFHPKEKKGTKNRRLFSAKKIGLIDPSATAMKVGQWKDAIGKEVIVDFEWNTWNKKNEDGTFEKITTGNRVKWDGYHSVTEQPEKEETVKKEEDDFGI